MNKDKKIKNIKKMMYNMSLSCKCNFVSESFKLNHPQLFNRFYTEDLDKFINNEYNLVLSLINDKVKIIKGFTNDKVHYIHSRHLIIKECINIKLEPKEIFDMWLEQNLNSSKNKATYKLKPTKEGRDNKGVYVGSGHGNKNAIRYPKKNRSKRVWKTFYEMFPHKAISDNWDGNTSDKMK